jgi:hypothetical protein
MRSSIACLTNIHAQRDVSAGPRRWLKNPNKRHGLELTDRVIQLEAALRANVALRVPAERLIAAYVAPESDRPTIINELIALFDGPAQREAQMLEAQA